MVCGSWCVVVRWVMVMTLLLVLYQHLVTAHVSSETFRKFTINSSLAALQRCPALSVLEIPGYAQLPRVFCSHLCSLNSACRFFSLEGGNCLLQTLKLTPGYDAVSVISGLDSYTVPSTEYDLAFLKPIQAGSTWNGYPNPPSVVNGDMCWTKSTQCSCTDYNKQWITVDLLTSVNLTRIVVTSSFDVDQEYYAKTDIHVGNTGSYTTDAIVASKDGTSPSMPLETFTYNVAVKGRYVTLHRTDNTALCLCSLQVFSD
ncbi:uncharacterized protein [Cherax quadricarinatus]|nr:uncharacterized protein LOC128699712 [Cherax quadricarinatus]